MRDFDVAELQAFLAQHTIKYDTAPKEVAARAEDKPAEAEQGERFYCVMKSTLFMCRCLYVAPLGECPVAVAPVDGAPAPAAKVKPCGCKAMLQKETMEGLIDEECGEHVLEGHAGLCQ